VENSRVKRWRLWFRQSLSVSPCFLRECLTSISMPMFPSLATSNRTCGFPAYGFLVCFVPRVMYLSAWKRFRDVISYLVAVIYIYDTWDGDGSFALLRYGKNGEIITPYKIHNSSDSYRSRRESPSPSGDGFYCPSN